MNPALAKALSKLGGIIASAALAGFGGLLGKLMEPFFKWMLFTGLRGLIWLLPQGKVENAVISLQSEFEKAYKED